MKTMRGLFKLKIIQYQKNKKSNDVEILISENRTTLIDAVNIKPSLESWTVKKIYSLVKTSKKSQLMTCISCRRKTKRCHQSFAISGKCIYNIIPFYASCHFNAFHYSASSHKWKPYTFTNLQTVKWLSAKFVRYSLGLLYNLGMSNTNSTSTISIVFNSTCNSLLVNRL